jgi:Rrf2 family cysteine metabolism transcriptional repressor
MRVSAKAEYACVAMLELAANHAVEEPVRVKNIADAHDIPQRFLVQILLQLKGAGLVESTRGAAGGYQLARRPEDISLADVVNAIDRGSVPRAHSPRRLGRRRTGRLVSPVVTAIHSVWREVQDAEQRLLTETTLADLVRRAYQDNALSYQI